jgi:predicted 3-demethylubiquinone-9 3-methyltransferase (glyoxalase superfamily)
MTFYVSVFDNSKIVGWVQDRFGVSWQLILAESK